MAKSTNDIQCIKNIVEHINDYEIPFEVLVKQLINELNDDDKLTLIHEINDSKLWYAYRCVSASHEFIIEHLEDFLVVEGIDISRKEIILRMFEKNNDILRSDFRILDDRFISCLGEDKVNQISCYPEIINDFLHLNDKELIVISKSIDSYMQKTDGADWTTLTERLLENINQYSELLDNIENIEEVNFDKLVTILIHNNDFGIKEISDIEKFQEIKAQKCMELINSGNINDMRNAVLQKLFGQNNQETIIMIHKYGDDIKHIENADLRDYILCLQELMKIEEPQLLQQIYQQVDELEFNNPLLIERLLKSEYAKMFNQNLFKVENAEKIDGEENMYKAGTDFRMIITAIGAFFGNPQIEDYNSDWNRPTIASQHFCSSYLSNEMLGHANTKLVYYGFSNMSENALLLCGQRDIWSTWTGFVSKVERKGSGREKYLTPDNQINRTDSKCRYNEMDYSRIQDGKKKQPDYIIIFKKNGVMENLENSKKASKDFNGLPIVVIDVDECLKVEKERAEAIKKEYEEKGTPELARKLYYKIRNNRITNYRFFPEIDLLELRKEAKINEEGQEEALEELQDGEKKISKEDLKPFFEEVNAQDRQEESGKIKRIYEQIKGIVREGNSEWEI